MNALLLGMLVVLVVALGAALIVFVRDGQGNAEESLTA